MSDASPSPTPLVETVTVPAGPAAAAVLLQPLLARAAGADAETVSLNLDYGPALVAGATVRAEAWIERATRTIVFAQGRIMTADGGLAVQAAAVFRRGAPPNPAKEDRT
jgi:acyl-coenzyme A thioesterase PaaI-like protein